VYQQYPQIGPVLPAMGYSSEQLEALGATLNHTPADLIVSGTPIDLGGLIQLNKPIHRVHYEFADLDSPGLGDWVESWLAPLASGIVQAPA
jgi:predicted GTPase